MTVLDSLNVVLRGSNLVEAAAGTGKTYNIQNIVARLILEGTADSERCCKINEIVVLSFTTEAAAELGVRIRTVLTNIAALLESGGRGDEQAAGILTAVKTRHPETADEEFLKRIKLAIRDFDLANISTINGFCQRILVQYAFESRQPFNSTLLTSPGDLVNSLYRDWQREQAFTGGTVPAGMDELRHYVLDFNLNVPEFSLPDDLITILQESAPEFFDRLEPYIKRNSTVYTRMEPMLKALREKDIYAVAGLVDYFTPEKIERGVNQDGWNKLPDILNAGAGFMEACRNVSDCCRGFGDCALYTRRRELLFKLRERFLKLEKKLNFMTYADQIRLVDRALQESPQLTALLRKKFTVCIIDEFQDTDRSQYRIFKTLFQGDGHCMFLVGDPRQSIYRFRGGDVNAYIRARGEVDHCYELNVNYRSSKAMVLAVNDIFSTHDDPFYSKDIHFSGLKSREKAPELQLNGVDEKHALYLHRIGDSQITPARLCTDRIVEMLNAGFSKPVKQPDGSFEYCPLTPGDFAVLMCTNDQCAEMRTELELSNVPAVCLRNGNVFASDEAADFYQVLAAVVSPLDRKKFNSALATRLGGVTLEEIYSSPEVIEVKYAVFAELNNMLRSGDFAGMFAHFMQQFDVRIRYAGRPDGRRRLTNLMQISELLQKACTASKLRPEALLELLNTLISSSDAPVEHEELMSTDNDAVRVMTIHASKGLQFPVVMLPVMDDLRVNPGRIGMLGFDGTDRILNLGKDPIINALIKKEEFQERLRLAYVALTRAEFRCEVFTFREGDPANISSAWDYLYRGQPLPGSGPENHFACLVPPQRRDLEAPPVITEMSPDWQILSFSSLARDKSAGAVELAPDHDDDEDDNDLSGEENFSPYTLGGGAEFGNMFHKLMETLPFDSGYAALRSRVEILLRIHSQLPGEDGEGCQEFVNGFTGWVKRILTAPLPDADGGEFSLQDIGEKERLNEMEFHFGSKDFDLQQMQQILDGYARSEELGLTSWPENWGKHFSGGMLTGFIDLIIRKNGKYYIVDWKSNKLDGVPGNFDRDGLRYTMIHSLYFLQYLIYTVALVRHLRRFSGGVFGRAEYEERFGGVLYLFVRGMSPDHPGRGVFRARPPWEVVSGLEGLLCR